VDASTGAGRPQQRSAKNYLLRPMVQVRLGIYSILLGVLFAAGTLGVLYAALTRVYNQLLALIVDKGEAARIVEQQFHDTAVWLVVLSVTFVVGTVVVSVLYTHRLVGPTFAFRRHLRSLREGRYEVRTALRRHDAFKEVADDLNELSEHLQAQQQRPGGAGAA
jgi:methyl-accepting chemotaxis protein